VSAIANSPGKRALAWVRRLINTAVPLALGYVLLLAAVPGDVLSERMHARHDRVVELLHRISVSQTWSMYAPDPARGHFYMELIAHDEDGNIRVLEESDNVEHGWGTAWAWNRTRRDIWQLTVTRKVEQVNRNRTWYLRGVCVRERRRGYDVARIEMNQVFRRIRTPEQVREGKELLGPAKRRRAQDGSCRVKIIREMLEADAARRGASDG
jgi:hypothetical protein